MQSAFAAEWERVDLLATCVGTLRRGGQTDDATRERLGVLQRRVAALRNEPAWSELTARCLLEPMDQDILSCVLAPDAEPHVGWRFLDLQRGIPSPHPTPALLRELLFLDGSSAARLPGRLRADAPLARSGLIAAPASDDGYAPVRSTADARRYFLGHVGVASTVPGATEIRPRATWGDLVLAPTCVRQLERFLLWITQREHVVGHWGAADVGGPVALFSGPSGTGKTFAAEAMASRLGWRLFRVDLGLLISKWVGETEKNLNRVFDAAEDRPLILLFDEADSLFGKRAEIRDARDRYANMEVNHLLSRIERHRGPCILTTNLRQHLEPAFVRRFHSVVDFPLPDAALRTRLWDRYLPPRAPRAGDVDTGLLGAAVQLTGGQIRNAAVHAAFLASADSMPITLGHVASAVWSELAKEGRELFRSNLGPLARYLEGDA